MELIMRLFVSLQATTISARHRTANRIGLDERGEGVISAAIAVLVIAVVGGLMFAAFKELFNSTSEKAKSAVGQIG